MKGIFSFTDPLVKEAIVHSIKKKKLKNFMLIQFHDIEQQTVVSQTNEDIGDFLSKPTILHLKCVLCEKKRI